MHHNVNIQEDKVTSALIGGVNQFLMVVRSPLLNLLHDGYEIMHLGDLITTQLNVETDNGERVISTTTTTGYPNKVKARKIVRRRPGTRPYQLALTLRASTRSSALPRIFFERRVRSLFHGQAWRGTRPRER